MSWLNSIDFRSELICLDGGLATELERKGADLKDPLWSAKLLIENPELIKTVHLDYLKSGAEIIETSTYQATIEGFEKKGYSRSDSLKFFELSVKLARDAVKDFVSLRKPSRIPLIAGSIGSFGAHFHDGRFYYYFIMLFFLFLFIFIYFIYFIINCLLFYLFILFLFIFSEFTGNYGNSTDSQILEFHRTQLSILKEQKDLDLIAFETVPCLREARQIIKLISEEKPKQKIWISFSCKNSNETCAGDKFSDCISEIGASNSLIWGIGINCTNPEFVSGLLSFIPKDYPKMVLVYPNSGEIYDGVAQIWLNAITKEPVLTQGKTVFPNETLKQWRENRANIIGGCCRTTPDTIQSIHAYFNKV